MEEKDNYNKSDKYWDFTRNMSLEEVEFFERITNDMTLKEIIEYLQKDTNQTN